VSAHIQEAPEHRWSEVLRIIDIAVAQWKFNRDRTLATLKAISEASEPQQILAWRPGPGRAHIGWQLMHIGITEERFALMRPIPESSITTELIERFRGGSVPDDDVPALDEISRVLEESRSHLLATVSQLTDADLETIPERFRERGWTLATALQVVSWHEPHHQGQAHITLNLWKARH